MKTIELLNRIYTKENIPLYIKLDEPYEEDFRILKFVDGAYEFKDGKNWGFVIEYLTLNDYIYEPTKEEIDEYERTRTSY